MYRIKVMFFLVPAVVMLGCEKAPDPAAKKVSAPVAAPVSAPAPVVDQARVEAYIDGADADEVMQIVERKRLAERYLAAADDRQLKALLAKPGMLERVVSAAGKERVVEAAGGGQDAAEDVAGFFENADDAEVRRIVKDNALVDRYLASAEPGEMHEIVSSVRAAVDRVYLTPAAEHVARFASYADGPESDVSRILKRGPLDGMTTGRGGGAYYSFVTRENDYNQTPDIQLQSQTFSAGFSGGHFGCVQALDGVTFVEAGPDDMSEVIRTDNIARLRSEGRQPDCRAAAEAGKVYAVRSHHTGTTHDTLAVLEVIDMDDDGLTFVWRKVTDRTASNSTD